jgi:hypothetical protein
MEISKNISKDPVPDESIDQLLRHKKDENVALKKLLNALGKAKQIDSGKPKMH